MSCGISETTTAMNTSAGTAVLRSAKYGNAHSSIVAAPIMYIRLRPIRSERWPKNGVLNSDSAAAAITA